jgi:hypothetical protein
MSLSNIEEETWVVPYAPDIDDIDDEFNQYVDQLKASLDYPVFALTIEAIAGAIDKFDGTPGEVYYSTWQDVYNAETNFVDHGATMHYYLEFNIDIDERSAETVVSFLMSITSSRPSEWDTSTSGIDTGAWAWIITLWDGTTGHV